MPQIIKFYLGENPVIDNIETWRCSEKKDLQHVLKTLKI